MEDENEPRSRSRAGFCRRHRHADCNVVAAGRGGARAAGGGGLAVRGDAGVESVPFSFRAFKSSVYFASSRSRVDRSSVRMIATARSNHLFVLRSTGPQSMAAIAIPVTPSTIGANGFVLLSPGAPSSPLRTLGPRR